MFTKTAQRLKSAWRGDTTKRSPFGQELIVTELKENDSDFILKRHVWGCAIC